MNDIVLKELEKEYNWFMRKVIVLPKGTKIQDVKKAVANFMKEIETLDDEDFEDHVYGLEDLDNHKGCCLSVESGWGNSDMQIFVEPIKAGYAFIRVDEPPIDFSDNAPYLSEMYAYVDEYLNKIAVNKCPHCGEKITGKGIFCSNCGTKLI